MTDKWTDERVALLVRRRTQAIPASMSEIAQELGTDFTRNSVIGKANRLRLAGVFIEGEAASVSTSVPVRKAQILPKTADIKIKLAAPTPVVASAPVSPIELKRPAALNLPETDLLGAWAVDMLDATVCKWPIGDPLKSDFRFCGCRANGTGSYCGPHALLAYQPSDRRRAAAAARR